jgi:hypothetical protein
MAVDGRSRPTLVRCAIGAVAGLALTAGTGCNPILGPSQPDANWRVVESARFSIHVRPGSFAEQNAGAIGAALDGQYAATIAAIGAPFGARVSAFLYDSGRDADFDNDHSGVAYPETLAFRAVCVSPLDANLISLLSHEANHVIIAGALGRAGTSMMSEGLASAVLSEERHPIGRSHYYVWTRTHRAEIPPMSRLVDDNEWDRVPQPVSYAASASFLAYLLETAGPERLRAVYHADSRAFAVRFSEVYGKPLNDAEREWLDFCERR